MSNHSNGAWELVQHYLGPLKEYFDLPGVSEIRVNQYDKIFIEQFGEKRKIDARFDDEQTLQTTIIQIANTLGQTAHPETHPILDARLNDGSRVGAVLYPTAVLGSNMTIRIFPKEKITVEKLIESGSLTPQMLEFLKIAVVVSTNMLVSGSCGSGKTTLLNILSTFIPPDRRLLVAEDTHELQIEIDDLIIYEAPLRRDNDEDRQKVDLSLLIKTILRHTPDQIFVGEIRDSQAAIAFLQASNTGHCTSSTTHADSCEDALVRLQTLIAEEWHLPWEVLEFRVKNNIKLLIHAEKTPRHGRRVVQIAEVQKGELRTLWEFNHLTGKHEVKEEVLASSEILKNARKHGFPVPETWE